MERYKMFGFSRKFRDNEKAPPTDIRDAFERFSGSAGHQIAADQLLRFLVDHQDEAEATIEDAVRLIDLIHGDCGVSSASAKGSPSITLDDFHRYLFSEQLNPPIQSRIHHDMNSPLSHYYVFTGHNSYLTGNQLSSDCSDTPIINALERGVRVIELDMWPNSAKDDVEILHGRTLTSPVKLIDCLRSIRKHAFVASPYPVVITLEDHLTPDLQAKVAKMITETFGDMLFCPKTKEGFPSPESLKNRIIISTKPPKEYLESKTSKGKKDVSRRGKSRGEASSRADLDDSDKSDVDQSDEDQDEDDSDDDGQKSFQNAAPKYKHIIAIKAGKPKGGLEVALKVNPNKVRRLSLSENQLEKATESYGTNIVSFSQKNFLRVYPKGTRFTSSNYNPLIGWMHGAQMVAFNMQGYGKKLWLMQGFFRANGGCGFVKKPDFLTSDGIFDPKKPSSMKRTLKVKVYMGDGWRLDFGKTHFDTFSPPDFYTRVGIGGVPADRVMKKTKVIDDDWTPVWNEEFRFPLTVPELAVLRIEVYEHDVEKDDFAGQACLPVVELRQGIRTVPLFDKKGIKFSHTRLLMRFEFC